MLHSNRLALKTLLGIQHFDRARKNGCASCNSSVPNSSPPSLQVFIAIFISHSNLGHSWHKFDIFAKNVYVHCRKMKFIPLYSPTFYTHVTGITAIFWPSLKKLEIGVNVLYFSLAVENTKRVIGDSSAALAGHFLALQRTARQWTSTAFST
jgi:hypothetical protein